MSTLNSMVVVGSGNIANHFAKKFQSLGWNIVAVVSRNRPTGEALANSLNTEYFSVFPPSTSSADFILLAVSDKSIHTVSKDIPKNTGVVLHTSGSVSMDMISTCDNYGVLYPLQGFSLSKEVDFENVPFLIEANNEATLQKIQNLSKTITSKVYEASSEERLYLHLAAVFASNFTNALYGVAKQLLEKNTKLSFDLLLPLINETAAKLLTLTPKQAQTGPAKRGDEEVMNKHVNILQSNPKLMEIYQQLSSLVQIQQNEKL